MDWTAAKDRTIQRWKEVLAGVGETETVELLRQVNEVCELCEKAQEKAQAKGELAPCPYCIAQQQVGGCIRIRASLSRAIVDEEWARVREIMEGFLHDVESVVPPGEVR
ncbi:MAG: hypothetical protein HYY93_10230 [Planctomycetes bacterium]|nr:hypothetical protein [Planctomycetota bacterium]